MRDPAQHTPEPWSVDPRRALRIHAAHDNTIASTGATDSLRDQWEANAQRIVSCVNALAGLNPEAVGDVVNSMTVILALYEDANPRAAALADQGHDCSISRARAALAKLTSQP